MGNKNLDSQANESEESYKIVTFKGIDVPAQYHNLIYKTFLTSLKDGSKAYKDINKERFFLFYPMVLKYMFSQPEVYVNMAIAKDDNDFVYGWCVHEKKEVHYIWIKGDVRHNGIGQSLLPKEFDTVTFKTRSVTPILEKYYPEVRIVRYV